SPSPRRTRRGTIVERDAGALDRKAWSGFPGDEAAGAREAHELAEPVGLFPRHGPAGLGDPVIPASLIVELRRGTLVDFADQVVVQHPLDGSIESAWAEADFAACSSEDFLDDGVAVAVFVRQGHQDVKNRGLQHGSTISIVGITSMDIRRMPP